MLTLQTRSHPEQMWCVSISIQPNCRRQYGYRADSHSGPRLPRGFMDGLHAKGWVDLSDYQALSRLFTLECRPPITDQERLDLWNLENGDGGSALESLDRLLNGLPIHIDYVLVLGDTCDPRNLDFAQRNGPCGHRPAWRVSQCVSQPVMVVSDRTVTP